MILIAFPLVVRSEYAVFVLNMGLIFAMLAASWDILSGYSGQLSFGHAGFFGAGAYTAILSVMHYGVNPWLAMLLGAVMTGIIAFLTGVLTLRLRGPYLALMTLALSQVLHILVIIFPDFTRGSLGISGYEGLLRATDYIGYYYVGLALAALVVVSLYLFGKSRYGVTLRAIRDDELKARTMGINTTAYKVVAFVLSGAVAGLAGGYYGFLLKVLTPGVFDVMHFSAMPIALSIMGGIGTIIGPGVFALIFGVIGELLTSFGPGYNYVLLGLLVVLTVIYMPQGLWSKFMLRSPARTGSKAKATAAKGEENAA